MPPRALFPVITRLPVGYWCLAACLGLTVRGLGMGRGLEIIHLLRIYPAVGAALGTVHASSYLIFPKLSWGLPLSSHHRGGSRSLCQLLKAGKWHVQRICLSRDTSNLCSAHLHLSALLALWRAWPLQHGIHQPSALVSHRKKHFHLWLWSDGDPRPQLPYLLSLGLDADSRSRLYHRLSLGLDTDLQP